MSFSKSKIKTSQGSLQIHVSGTGDPPIILINGGSGPIEGWMRVLPALSAASSVFAYNRFGVAGSDKPASPQDGVAIVEALREALSMTGFKPPYLLVGHSLGGLYAQLFARLHPAEAAGVVFLEASHPRDLALQDYQGKGVKAVNRLLSLFDSLSPHKKFGEVHFVERTAEQIRESGDFPDIPVWVVTGGKENRFMPPEARRHRMQNQLELVVLSRFGEHVIASKSGHFPQLTEPSVVMEAILACLERIRVTSAK
ncbi:alpha/beta fold hydrolase [Cohnella candidum]|uniref:Alpha/beta hydrolase n=1 Tax=Cohnella candidum TaxID=2674991 RepID=A0A3G3JXR0_9BACL|nr:alpha/beta hydrolase [Cohnella candidum]AYQ72641.1 alpha/beta hydrolase [Cohnella candidum]